jgi:hypothetical protein
VLIAEEDRDADGVPIEPLHVRKSLISLYGSTRWTVALRHNGSLVTFGTYDSRADAARSADRASIVLYGDRAALNMPRDITDQEKAELQAVSDVTAYAYRSRALASPTRRAQQLLDGALRRQAPHGTTSL